MKQIIAQLIKIADELDDVGMYDNANEITDVATDINSILYDENGKATPILYDTLIANMQDQGRIGEDPTDEDWEKAEYDTIKILREQKTFKPIVKKHGDNYISGIAITDGLGDITKEWDYANPLANRKTAEKYAILRAKELNNN